MGTLDDEFSFLAFSVERAVEVQEQVAQQLLAVSSGRGKVLAKRLIAHYRQLRNFVAERREALEEYEDDKPKEGAITEMRTRLGYARGELQSCLAWLDAASESVLDLGTEYLIEFLASRLVSPDSEVTVVTKSDGSYSISVSDLLDKTIGDEEEDAGIAIVVFIPRREQRSGLLHTLILHELGHAASRQHDLAQGIIDEAKKGVLKEAHEAAAESVAAQMEVDEALRIGICGVLEIAPIEPDAVDALTTAAGDFLWIPAKACVEETVCDAFAIKLLGPTYLYAFAAIVGTSDLDIVDHEHPSARLRIKLMLEHLDELHWTPLLEQQTPEIYGWFRDRAGERGSMQETIDNFSATAVVSLASRVRDVVDEHVDDLSFSPEEFDEKLSGAIEELLSVGIPPSQLQDLSGKSNQLKTIGRPEVILGSWLFAIAEGGGSLEAIAKAPALPELSSLLPKALELSALERAWEEAA